MATIKQLPDGKYQARFRDEGGRQHARRFSRRRDAAEWLDIQTAALVRGDFVAPSAGKVTFKEYAEKWREAQAHHRAGTVAHVESRLRLHVYPEIGHRQLRTIQRIDVQRVVNVAAQTLAPSSVEVLFGFMSSVFSSAVLDKIVSSSPCVKINLPEVVERKVVPLTVEQVDAIYAAVPSYYRPMVAVAAATGLRSGELRGLTIDRISPALHLRGDLTPKEATLRIDRQLVEVKGGRPTFGPPKTDSADRRILIGESTIRTLTEHLTTRPLGPDGLVFTGRMGGPISRTAAGEVWRKAIDGMGLPDRSGWHDLRHFHVSLLIASGRSPRAVADRLGHKDPVETLRTYSHLWPDDEERSVSATEAAIGHLGARGM